MRVGSPDGGSTLRVSLNHEKDHPGELIEVYARMGKPGAIEAGLFEAVGRLASAFLQYAAEFGEDERAQAEMATVHQLVNIQSGYRDPAFFKFSDADKAVVVQSPCDGLAKAIQNYRNNHPSGQGDFLVQKSALNQAAVTATAIQAPNYAMTSSTSLAALSVSVLHQTPSVGRTQPACGKCGGEAWLKIDGCNVCQSCGFSKCG